MPLLNRGRDMTRREFDEERRQRDLRWLSFVERATRLSLAQVEKQSGIGHSTLSRIRRPNTTHHLSERAYGPVTRQFNIPGPLEFENTATPRALETVGFREEAVLFVSDATDPRTASVRALIGGRNNTHAWTISSDVLKRAGVLPGDVLIIEGGRTPQPGQIVCAQVYDRIGGLHADTVMRVYRPGWLMPAADDAIAWPPIKVAEGEVAVMGVMTHLIRSAL